jgi:hypothetical protein
VWLLLGLFLPVKYVLEVSSKIAKIKALESNRERRQEVFKLEGGTSRSAALVIAVLYILFVVVTNVAFPEFVRESAVHQYGSSSSLIGQNGRGQVEANVGDKEVIIQLGVYGESVRLSKVLKCINENGLAMANFETTFLGENQISIKVLSGVKAGRTAVFDLQEISVGRYAVTRFKSQKVEISNPIEVSNVLLAFVTLECMQRTEDEE